MIRFFFLACIASLGLTSCLLGGNEVTMMKTDEKALLNSSWANAQEAPVSVPAKPQTPATPAASDTDTTPPDTEVSPVSDVVSPVGAKTHTPESE